MYRSLRIDVDSDQLTVPSIEGCLMDLNGRYKTNDNVDKLYDWLACGSDTDWPVLEAKEPNKDDVIEHRTFGFQNTPIFVTPMNPKWMLDAERIAIARVGYSELLKSSIHEHSLSNQTEADATSLSETTVNVMNRMSELALFNANFMFQNLPIPERLIYENLTTLDFLITMVMTARRKEIYETDLESPYDYHENLYDQNEFAGLILLLNRFSLSGHWTAPVSVVADLNLLNENFFIQCASAYSMLSKIPMPTSYHAQEPDKVFFWAKKILEKYKLEVPELKVQPKPTAEIRRFPLRVV